MDQKFPWMAKYHLMHEVLTMLTMPPATATHNCGSLPIVGIFVTQILLPMVKGGYLEFGARVASNHQPLWIDLPAAALGVDELANLTN